MLYEVITHAVPILILSNEYLERPKFEIERIRKSEVTEQPSYERIEEPQAELATSSRGQPAGAATGGASVPAVTGIRPSRPVPVRDDEVEAPVSEPAQATQKPRQGFFGQLFSRLFGSEEAVAAAPPPAPKP